MLTFKEFLSESKKDDEEITGFATIHKDDDSDKELHKKDDELTGFSTIHKDDDSDKELKEAAISFVETLEPKSRPIFSTRTISAEVTDPYHKKYLDHIANTTIKERNTAFTHHRDLNQEHLEDLADEQSVPRNEVTSSIFAYTASSRDINKSLIRAHQTKKPIAKIHEKSVKEISRFTNDPQNSIKKSAIVHSGVGEKFGAKLETSKIGQKIHLPAFTSTSTNLGVAKTFVGRLYKSHHGEDIAHEHYLHFHLPKGFSKGRYVENISRNKAEHEVIIHHSTKWKKVGYHADEKKNNWEQDKVIHHHHLVPA